PDLVLIDVNLRGASGLEATHILKSDARPPKVIVLTLHDNQAYQGAALTVGADAFITKTDLGALLLPTIQRLYPSTAVYVS
ncbi:MAG TPA: response regulator, partial [Opitutaceae bacterium]|nr:response regulator [Opitutaceae bacterium]